MKFVLRLEHSFYGLVHVKTTMLKGNFIKYKRLKSIYKNVINCFAPNILGNLLPTIAKQNYQYLVPFIATR